VPEESHVDFYSPIGDCYVEYWGLGTPENSERQKKKLDLFKRYDIRVVELADRDVVELDSGLPGKLLKCFPDGYRFH